MSDAWIRALVAFPFGLVVGELPDRRGRSRPQEGVDRHPPVQVSALRSRDPQPRQYPRPLVVAASWQVSFVPSPHLRAVSQCIEAGTAASFVGVAIVYPRIYVIVMLCAFCAVMIVVGAIDLELKIIPNRITYPAFPVFAIAIVVGWAIGQALDPVRAAIGALLVRRRVPVDRGDRASGTRHGGCQAHRPDRVW